MTRDRLDRTYRGLMKLAGAYGMLALCVFFAGVPRQIDAGAHMLVPIAVATPGVLVAASLMRPRLLPPWFARPERPMHLVPVLLGHGLLPLLFLVPGMGAVIALNLPEPLSRALGTIAAGVPFALFGLCWWIGLALCLWRDTGGSSPQREGPATTRVVPKRPSYPKLSAEQLADLRRQRGG
ncbi:hypothetical protein [Salipiger aestuarii]|uniref:hypothetical protein n=1 Tax=Salipiger aestuarii TaxID=568098 RepID=UPI001238797C|nr:hypothetical protein [Salipiger aestuarii]